MAEAIALNISQYVRITIGDRHILFKLKKIFTSPLKEVQIVYLYIDI